MALAPEESTGDGEGDRSPRTLHPERWNEIVDAAGEVFDEKGYAAARIEDIAARVGLLKGSLYYYIDSKEDLLFAIVDGNHSRGIVVIEEGAALGAADPPARLGGFIDRWIAILGANPGYAAIAERDLRRLSPERQAIVMDKRARIHRFVRDIIEARDRRGLLRRRDRPRCHDQQPVRHAQRHQPVVPPVAAVDRTTSWRSTSAGFVLRGLGADPAADGRALP